MENKRVFIVTTTDTGCPHSWKIEVFDTEIVVPYEDKTYQYLIDVKSKMEEQIIATRILEEFWQKDIKNSIIQIIDISISKRMRTLLEFLSSNNEIIGCKNKIIVQFHS